MFEGHVVGGFPGSTFKVQMTDQQRLLYDEMYCKQSVMLPHDIIASLYDFPEIYHPLFTGEPGRIEWYWGQNMDLFESLGDPNLEAWLVVILVPCLLGLFLSICWLGSGKKKRFAFQSEENQTQWTGSVNPCPSSFVWGWSWCTTTFWDHDDSPSAGVKSLHPRQSNIVFCTQYI